MIGTLHFSIDFIGLTQLIRESWAEGRYSLAFHMLEASGAPADVFNDVIRGKLTLSNLDSTHGEVIVDTWSPAVSVFYPDPCDLPALAEQSVHWKEIAQSYLSTEYDLMLERYRTEGVFDGDTRSSLLTSLNSFPQEFLDSLPVDDRPANAMRTVATRDALKNYINHQLELDRTPAPPPSDPSSSANGWILPDGRFYACGYMEHDWLASALGFTVPDVEHLGWLRVGFGPFGDIIQHRASTVVPQRQLDALWDWCSAHNVPLPDWSIQ